MHAKKVRKTYRPPSPGEEYRRRLLLWSLSGFWPVSRVQRGYRTPGYKGCPTQPPIPPDGMSELEIERVQRLLARRNWTLVRALDGRLTPLRML